ncbi:unnamed protein product [Paramecium primaurelia]|uniref:Protein kinase domain-containing protein n=1 Tax=Paramecium primaurelia TaxID=5886 RepID=A0A8S1MLD9_PARPR|nr:unnamed protein product [Paramecium primaurelia]
MNQYYILVKIGEGTFSEVLKAKSMITGQLVAIKCMKNRFESVDQVKNLKEIQALHQLQQHPNIVKLHEVLYDEPSGRLALVCELMEMNLYDCIKNRTSYLSMAKVKKYMHQVLKALDYMHKRNFFHRDIKPENILIKNDNVKVADLGSCKGIHSTHPYTEYISTRWYRAPECLMTDGYYDQKMDLWGVGCVMFEIIALLPLFQGENELDQINKIFKILGTPEPELLNRFKSQASHMEFNFKPQKGIGLERLVPPHAGSDCIDLLYKLLQLDPVKRINAEEALRHEFFEEFWDAPMSQSSDSTQFGKAITITKPKKRLNKGIYPGTIKLEVKLEGKLNQSDDENEKVRDGSLHSKLPPITKPYLKPKVKNPYVKKKLYDDYIIVGKKALN